jgi:HSP20 family protein
MLRRKSDTTDWMWAHACEVMARAERMQRQFFRVAAPGQAVWEPPVDVFEDEHEVAIVVALPGVAAEHVEVTSQGGTLVVRARRPQPLAGSRHAVRQMEIPYGLFERRIALPAGRLEVVSRELTHGCLLLRLRRIHP